MVVVSVCVCVWLIVFELLSLPVFSIVRARLLDFLFVQQDVSVDQSLLDIA